MRNGVYRVWVDGPSGKTGGAVVLKDGNIYSVDRQYAFNGHYIEHSGRFSAALKLKRLFPGTPPFLPDRDELHMRLQGGSGREHALLEGSLDEVPDFVMSLQYAFLCEA